MPGSLVLRKAVTGYKEKKMEKKKQGRKKKRKKKHRSNFMRASLKCINLIKVYFY